MTDHDSTGRSLGDLFVAVTGTTTVVETQQTAEARRHAAASSADVELSNYLAALSKVDGLEETVDEGFDVDPVG